MKLEGRCLCESVKFSFETPEPHFDACHCSMCRKWGGGPLFAVFAASDVEIDGKDNITTYESSDWAQRSFCKSCGTHLYYSLKDGSFINFSAGTIKGHENFKFTKQIYTDKKPESYNFSNETQMMTEKEVLALFGAD